MKKYMISEGQILEFLEREALKEKQKIAEQVYSHPIQSEMTIPKSLICAELPDKTDGKCGVKNCICKDIDCVDSGDICRWMQHNLRMKKEKKEPIKEVKIP